MITPDWERRMAGAWASFDELDEARFLRLVEDLTGELAPDDPVGLFERAGSLDAVGRTGPAVPLYRRALAAGLTGSRRRQAVIQLASSLRELGEAAESVALLTAEMAAGSDELDDAVKAVLALALADAGRAREAVGIAVGALSAHLPRYQRSMATYARLLLEPDPAADPEADVHS
ncbi:tetratricopeptide repeat protein [Actinoplanes auranticolor]|uniref:Tetratrico peptide repeat group 5 domain-containing protein n=1 Tax=Actinoplanes auranticolor TaxID=47988 RepID=A0A919SQX4_9ACTN|nr:tetratricopeptide repeat protein [Actinoplanes auranticolor]GIM75934.1 hypothetical protein Aau02nite_68420 [Actinoplanes auranticolor]